MPRKRIEDGVPILEVPEGATSQIYDISREEFTAADLQKFTEKMEGVPFQKVISQLEGIQRRQRSQT